MHAQLLYACLRAEAGSIPYVGYREQRCFVFERVIPVLYRSSYLVVMECGKSLAYASRVDLIHFKRPSRCLSVRADEEIARAKPCDAHAEAHAHVAF